MKYEENVWYGWNGGECPVHPETVVEVVFSDGNMNKREKANIWNWDHGDPNPIIAFRVIKEHKEPREFWLVISRSGHTVMAAESEEMAKEFSQGANGRSIIHVREVLE